MMKRYDWLSILAKAKSTEIYSAWEQSAFSEENFDIIWLRKPEIGLLPLQARMGNSGNKFLFGDVTVTRAVLQFDKNIGYSFVMGRDKRLAKICALIDAMMQSNEYKKQFLVQVMQPIHNVINMREQKEKADLEKTKVDFFTMIRGD